MHCTDRASGGLRHRLLAVMGVAICIVVMAGCGSASSSNSSSNAGGSTATTSAAGPATSSASTSTSTAPPAAAASILPLAQLYKGLEQQPPQTGPKAAKGKTVVWVSCGQSIPDCSAPAAAAQQAAKKLGWNFKITDGALDVNNGFATAVTQALADNPSAIILHAISCPDVVGPLEQAKARGVTIIGIEALNCNTPPNHGPSLFTNDMEYSSSMMSNSAYFTEWGRFGASYLIDKSPNAQLILSRGIEPDHVITNDGFISVFDKCSTCKVLGTATFSNPDLVPNGPYVQRLRAILAKYPTATAGYFPYDVNFEVGGAAAAKRANSKMFVSGGSGSPASFAILRQGLINGISAHDVTWLAWGAMDELNRIFNHQPEVPEGIGFIAVDKTHNLPPAGQPYKSKIDFASVYAKSWGAS
jgi:ribose transport system substrate-binding protein